MPKRASKPDAYEAVFSALAHPARRRVLLTVYFNGGEMTAGEIAAIFAHSWQTTTRHLQVLEGAGLLSHERQGRLRIYRIERHRLALVGDWLAHFQRGVKQRAGGKHVWERESSIRQNEPVKTRSA